MNGNGRFALIAIAALLVLGAADRVAAEDAPVDAMYVAFQRIVEDLNANEMSSFLRAVDGQAMLGKIYSERLIESRVRDQFTDTFDGQIESLFVGSFPPAEGDIIGRVVSFDRQGDRATAVVRFDLGPYQYLYHEFHLRAGDDGRIRVVDWVDFFWGERFTESIGDSLVMVMPGGDQTRSLLSQLQLTDAEAFQAAELFKAIRDQKPDRYFEILPGLDERIQDTELVAVTSVQLAQKSRNREQYQVALNRLAENFAGEPLYTVMLLDYYLPRRQFQQGLDALLRLQTRLGTEDAAILSQLATLELILGNVEDASTYAEAAVASETESELAWWAVLRTRTAQGQYDEAVRALTVLEKEFGHKLRGDALNRDAGLAQLAESDQYKAWRDGENP